MAGTTNVGEVQANLTLKTDAFEKGVKKAEKEIDKLKKTCKEATDASSYLGEGFKQMSKKITDFISPEHVVEAALLALAAAITAVIKVGDEMTTVFDDLQVGTGALGESLNDLNESLEKVIKNTSSDSFQISHAMADLNTYLGITGESLENLTSLVSKFADITHSSVTDVTASMSKAFNLWSVEESDYEATLNRFYGISQATGMGVSEIFSAVTSGAAFLQRFGYSIDEAAAELATFEKYGISASTVITGMKMAVSNMTNQGIEPTKEAWEELRESIADAETDQEAMNIAMQAFGSRYAADMVDAIKLANDGINTLSGNLDGLNTSLDESIQAQEETGLAEAWQKFSNHIALAAKSIFEFLEPALTWLVNGLTAVFEVLEPLFDLLGTILSFAIVPIRIAVTVLGNVLAWVKENVLDPIGEWLQNFLEMIRPLTDILAGIGDAISDFFGLTKEDGDEATESMESISDAVDDATKSMDSYCDSIDTAISKTKELTTASGASTTEDPYVNTGMNYHIENGYKIYADGTKVKESGTTYNNSITVTGGGYASEEMARIYAYNQAFNAVRARY